MSIIYIRKKFGTTMKWGMGVIAAIFLISAFYMYGGNMMSNAEKGQNLSREVAIVGGKPLLRANFDREFARRVAAYKEQPGGGQFKETNATSVKAQLLEEMSDRVLLLQEADRTRIKIGRKDVQKQIDEIKKSFPSDKAFRERLRSLGYDINMLRREITEGMRLQALVDKQKQAVSVSDADVKKAYKDQYKKEPAGKEFNAKAKEVREQLLGEKQSTALAKWMADLRKKADIQVVDAEIRAYKYLSERKDDKALLAFEKALKQNPYDPYIASVYYQIGQLYEKKSRLAKAEEAYDRGLKHGSSADLHLALGNIYRKQGKRDAALLQYEDASDLSYADFFMHYNLSGIYKEMGLQNKAADEEKRAQEIYGKQMAQMMQAQQRQQAAQNAEQGSAKPADKEKK